MKKEYKGLFWIFGWCATYTCGVSFSKYLTGSTSTFTLFCVRYMCCMLLFTPVLIPQLKKFSKPKSPTILFLLRILFMGGCSLLTYQTYRNLPLAIASCVGSTTPLFASFLGILFLKESISFAKILALITGFFGVAFVVQPTNVDYEMYYICTGLGASILSGATNALSRKLSSKDSALTIWLSSTFSLGIFGIIGFLIIAEPVNKVDVPFILAVGFFSSISQFIYVKALSYAEVSFISPFEYTRLLLAIPVGYFIFSESINYGQFLGIALIVWGCAYLCKKST